MHATPASQVVDQRDALPLTRRFKQRLLRVEAKDELPLRLRHERIYILPTTRGIAFVAVSLVMILASMNYGLNLGYALSFIFVGLFAACLLSTYLNLSQLTIESISSDDTFAGSPVEYHIAISDSRLESRARARYSITLQALDSTTTFDVRAGHATHAELRTAQTHRGIHQLGRLTISSDFPLGLWRGWGYVHTPAKTFIYPRPESPITAFPLSVARSTQRQTLAPEEREFDQLKRHQPTDTLSSVAWKTVARGRGWFSKEFTTTEAGNELIFSWSATEELQDPEQRLSRLCAWILQAETLATPYELDLPAYTTKSALGSEHRKNCLRQLSAFEPTGR